jgi:magnesium transporter
MNFIVNKKNLNLLVSSIEDGNDSFIQQKLAELHPVDIGEFLNRMEFDEADYILKVLPPQKAADVLVELDPDLRDKLVSTFTSREIAEMVSDNINSDDAADVLAELPPIKKEEVISLLVDAEQASDLVDLLGYEYDTAGGLMAKELIQVNEEWNVAMAIREMRRQAANLDEVYTIYVVNNKDQLVGTLSLKKLLFSDALRSSIKDLYKKTDVHFVYSSQSAEDVVAIMKKYDLVVLPVVDENHTLLGRITIDDAVDVMKDEAEKDYQMASGISAQVADADSVWVITRARIPWLLIGLIGGICVAQVIGMYEEQLQVNPKLAFFIPLIAAMGGNVGVQSSAIVVQGLANKSIDILQIIPRLGKELLVALINATICATLLLAYSFVFSADDPSLGYTISISLFSVVILAALFGTAIPLFLNKFKIDPALATGPFITTANDIIGLIIYFVVARLMYGL